MSTKQKSSIKVSALGPKTGRCFEYYQESEDEAWLASDFTNWLETVYDHPEIDQEGPSALSIAHAKVERCRNAVLEAAIAWVDSHGTESFDQTTLRRGYLYDRIRYYKKALAEQAEGGKDA